MLSMSPGVLQVAPAHRVRAWTGENVASVLCFLHSCPAVQVACWLSRVEAQISYEVRLRNHVSRRLGPMLCGDVRSVLEFSRHAALVFAHLHHPYARVCSRAGQIARFFTAATL